MTVLDASAVFAFLGDEPGRDVVGTALATTPCVMSAVNWSEVWQKAHQHQLPGNALSALGELVEIVPVDRRHGETAAALWTTAPHLSLADRVCLALAADRDLPAMTADQAWRDAAPVPMIFIR